MAKTVQQAFEETFAALRRDPGYIVSGLQVEIAEDIYLQLERLGINQADFARRLGVKPPYVTRLMQGTENLTLLTLARIAVALELEVDVRLVRPRKRPR